LKTYGRESVEDKQRRAELNMVIDDRLVENRLIVVENENMVGCGVVLILD
jgi:hypothetical protein